MMHRVGRMSGQGKIKAEAVYLAEGRLFKARMVV